jgi:hypothetical protein
VLSQAAYFSFAFSAAASISALVIASTRPLSFFAKLEIGTDAFTLPVLTTAFSPLTESIFPINSPLVSKTDAPFLKSAAVAATAASVCWGAADSDVVVVVVVVELCAGGAVPVALSLVVPVDVVVVLCVVVDWAGGGGCVSGVVLVVVVLVVFVCSGPCCEVVDVVCCVEVAVAG